MLWFTSLQPVSHSVCVYVLHLSRFCPVSSLHSKYWPLFLLFFYILSPIPYCISRRVVDDTDSASNACKELAIFLTTGIVISAFGLPIVFARAEVVSHWSLSVRFTGMTKIVVSVLMFLVLTDLQLNSLPVWMPRWVN